MSKIDEMIKELCPEGVERVKLSSLCNSICTGLNPRTNFKLNEEGAELKYVTVKEIATNKIVFSDSTDKISERSKEIINKRSRLEKGDILFSGIGTIGKVVYVDIETENWDCSESVFLLKPNEHVYGKYLSYSLVSKYVVSQYESCAAGAIMKGVRKATLENLEIPLPPLSIQQEIVSVLDSFTTLIDKMKQEVEKRKKQMEYYCDQYYGGDIEGMMALANDSNNSIITFAELGTITRGKRFVRDDVRESGQPCIHYGDMYTYYGTKSYQANTFLDRDFPKKMRYAKKGDVVIVGAGENDYDIGVGVVWMGNEPAAVHDACYILEHKQNPMYISYYLRSNIYHQQLKKHVSSGKISSFSAEGLGKVYIPIQPIEKQNEIVSTLDKFESYISKLEKMITLRQKQYEYYRERLLTF